ncbi:hypothetical protein TrVGV298_002237 [Trichoderma virens]|nr:hypothetical protein TrVGV298_002237 [Trichoderma virens]
MVLNVIDFGGIPFSEQIQIVRETDLLVGVHGAGLTHLMFLQPGSAVLEILPEGLQHKGFRNLAQMLGIGFFRAHAKMHGDASGDNQWQFDAVELDQRRLIDLINIGCEIDFVPTRFNVTVDLQGQRITGMTTKNTTAKDINPSRRLKGTVLRQFELIANDETNLYISTVGTAFNAFIADSRTYADSSSNSTEWTETGIILAALKIPLLP